MAAPLNLDEIHDLLEQAQDSASDGELAEAFALARRGLAALEDQAGEDPEDVVELQAFAHLLVADVCVEVRREEQALQHLQAVRELVPGDWQADYLESLLRIHRWEFDRAHELLLSCDPPDEDRVMVVYRRAIVAEFRGDQRAADELYEAACRTGECSRPTRISYAQAEAFLREVIAALPAEFRTALDNTRIEILDLPDRQRIGAEHSPLTLGIYSGTSLLAPDGRTDPAAILLFKRNIERLAEDRDELLAQLRITLLHEVGHHLGFDEEGLERLGLE